MHFFFQIAAIYKFKIVFGFLMQENNPLNENEITIPTKIKGNTYFDSNKCLNYYQKIICDFDFYFIDKNANQSLINEIKSIFSYKIFNNML